MRHERTKRLTAISRPRLTEVDLSLPRLALSAVACFALAACSKSDIDCSPQSKLVNGACRPTCQGDRDCLQTERCDTAVGACVAQSNPPSDAGGPETGAGDAGKDAEPADSEHRDRGVRDTGISADAEAPDKGLAADAEVPDTGASCTGMTQDQCTNNPSCRAQFCIDCHNNQIYRGCYDVGDMVPPCPLPNCVSCDQNLDEATCRTSGICHPVFVDQPGCGCTTAGCCMRFSFCATGAQAMCMPSTITCGMQMPVCEGTYVNSYTLTCYEGCVTPDEC
jgi:hypothetical protein